MRCQNFEARNDEVLNTYNYIFNPISPQNATNQVKLTTELSYINTQVPDEKDRDWELQLKATTAHYNKSLFVFCKKNKPKTGHAYVTLNRT